MDGWIGWSVIIKLEIAQLAEWMDRLECHHIRDCSIGLMDGRMDWIGLDFKLEIAQLMMDGWMEREDQV